MPDDKSGYVGHQVPTSSGSDHNTERLHIESAMDERRTMVPVRIVKVYPGKDGAAPTADVQPLIDQVDGLGNRTPHAVVYGVAVGRNHSGSGAFTSDPVAGDTYKMHVADRDISSFKATGQQAGPGSKRRSSLSDGVLGQAINAKPPTQGVTCKPGGGIIVFDKGGARIETSADGDTVTITNKSGATVLLQGDLTILGGDPAKGGTFGFVQTDAGTSSVVKAKL